MGRVLVIEDHPFHRRLVRDTLEYRGREANGVEQARERLQDVRSSIVLLGGHLSRPMVTTTFGPEMTGLADGRRLYG